MAFEVGEMVGDVDFDRGFVNDLTFLILSNLSNLARG